jgi:hypothetical protein
MKVAAAVTIVVVNIFTECITQIVSLNSPGIFP